ncbi:MAG: hypothetical protein ACRDPW_03145 [Mycobacteriales bacterium]
MKVDKMSISLASDLGDAVRGAARKSDAGLSAWFADAAAVKLRAEALNEFLEDWESKHGAPTAAELASAESELGLRSASAEVRAA